MLGIISTLLGSAGVIEKGMDLIDDIHTSDEEAIVAKVSGKVALLQAYAPFKVAQRYLALLFSFTFLGSFLLVLGMTLNGTGNVSDVKEILSEFYIGEIMFTIIGFYFGGGFLEGSIKSWKDKSNTEEK